MDAEVDAAAEPSLLPLQPGNVWIYRINVHEEIHMATSTITGVQREGRLEVLSATAVRWQIDAETPTEHRIVATSRRVTLDDLTVIDLDDPEAPLHWFLPSCPVGPGFGARIDGLEKIEWAHPGSSSSSSSCNARVGFALDAGVQTSSFSRNNTIDLVGTTIETIEAELISGP
jgi:hypothetical protein